MTLPTDSTPKKKHHLLIGNALNRHEISDQYHTEGPPGFMKSMGPFCIYDHAKAKGGIFADSKQVSGLMAKRRF